MHTVLFLLNKLLLISSHAIKTDQKKPVNAFVAFTGFSIAEGLY
ncbi:hypothetical protein M917_2558 [Psychrobacter aquaticus CMS 56]|uniref:Uncharacterized protein n=1 Tax=Psychrobacter aquaticus CMS 56 TaxID=1354303 RepID=U4T1Y0_9GAMM|nr:hypothetical protein M917_2558 [Psychrobacter aquaticus CMS 56]